MSRQVNREVQRKLRTGVLAPGGTGRAGYGTVSAPADTTVGGGAGAGSDLVIPYWDTAEEPDTAVLETLVDALDLSGPRDIEGFNKALGLLVPDEVPGRRGTGRDSMESAS